MERQINTVKQPQKRTDGNQSGQPFPIQVIDIKWKDRQIQLNIHKKNRWRAELANLSHTDGNSVTQT